MNSTNAEPEALHVQLSRLLTSKYIGLSTVGLIGDVIAADARFNDWVVSVAKRTFSIEALLAVIGVYEGAAYACSTTIAHFSSSRDRHALEQVLGEILQGLQGHFGR
jgi:hypothetical protein